MNKETVQPTVEQIRIAKQFEYAMESYYFTKEVVQENGREGISYYTEGGSGEELVVGQQMLQGVIKAVGARYKDLRGTGDLGKRMATDIVLFVQRGHEKTNEEQH